MLLRQAIVLFLNLKFWLACAAISIGLLFAWLALFRYLSPDRRREFVNLASNLSHWLLTAAKHLVYPWQTFP